MRCRSVGSKIGASVRLNGRESKWPLTTATRSERRQTGVSPRSVSRRNWTREGHFVTVATRYPSLPLSLPLSARRSARRWKKKRKKMENLDGSKGYFLSDTPLVRVQRYVCNEMTNPAIDRPAQHLLVVRTDDTPFDRNESWPRIKATSSNVENDILVVPIPDIPLRHREAKLE